MYERILVAVDASPTSERALQEAARLAGVCNARLRVVHVADEVTLSAETSHAAEEFARKKLDAASAVLTRAQQLAEQSGATVETRLLELDTFKGSIAELIVAQAADWPADLVVMGTHGRRGLSHLLLGSVAEHVLRVSSTPLLLVRSP
ncbi:MAG TPA: universal stress protein [Gammaproteobacteria bacterium]|nr:universal stress protein [Gammaproteobacteria bacterium]